MKINYLEIKRVSKKLESYKGYLPVIIRMQINSMNYIDNLKKEGLFDKLMVKLGKSRHLPYEKLEDELKQWIDENPEFSFLVEY